VRQYLVHAAAQRHVTEAEQGHQPIGHIIHCARTPPATRRQTRRIGLRNCPEGAAAMQIGEESPYRFVISRHGRMRVPGVVFATRRSETRGQPEAA